MQICAILQLHWNLSKIIRERDITTLFVPLQCRMVLWFIANHYR